MRTHYCFGKEGKEELKRTGVWYGTLAWRPGSLKKSCHHRCYLKRKVRGWCEVGWGGSAYSLEFERLVRCPWAVRFPCLEVRREVSRLWQFTLKYKILTF